MPPDFTRHGDDNRPLPLPEVTTDDVRARAREVAHSAYHEHNKSCGCRTVGHLTEFIADRVLDLVPPCGCGLVGDERCPDCPDRSEMVLDRKRAIEAGVNAIQEEFDERGLGDASLIVGVVLDESGYPAQVERLSYALDGLVAAVTQTDTDARYVEHVAAACDLLREIGYTDA